MTRFVVEGGFNHRRVQLTWEDGVLTGDEQLVAIIQRWVDNSQGYLIMSSGGAGATHDHLKNPWVANELMEMFLDQPEIVEGELPPVFDPAPPEGAIY